MSSCLITTKLFLIHAFVLCSLAEVGSELPGSGGPPQGHYRSPAKEGQILRRGTKLQATPPLHPPPFPQSGSIFPRNIRCPVLNSSIIAETCYDKGGKFGPFSSLNDRGRSSSTQNRRKNHPIVSAKKRNEYVSECLARPRVG